MLLKKEDTQVQGLRMQLTGGQYDKKKQMAIIEFQCDLDRTGNEGFGTADGEMVSRPVNGSFENTEAFGADVGSSANIDLEDDEQDDGKSLSYVSYGETDDKTDLLRLNWRTKYACDDFEDDEDEPSGESSHWGFFTWFIILCVPHYQACIRLLLTARQCFSWSSGVSHFRFVAELQSVWRPGLGFTTTWRHYPRHPLSLQGLVEEGRRNSARRRIKRRI